MDLTQEEKDALADEIRTKIRDEIKVETKDVIEKINTNLKDRFKKIEELEKKMGVVDPASDDWKKSANAQFPPMLSGMKPDPGQGLEHKAEETFEPLIFQDASGKEHKARRFNEKLFEGKEEDFSVGKIIRAKILGDLTGLNDFEHKSAGEGIGSLGGWLISETVSAKIIQLARNLAAVQKAGAYTIDMPTPEMRLVKILSDPQAYWVAEHGEIQESSWQIGPINLKAMTIGCLVRASIEILEDAANAGSALEQAMAAAISLAMDRVALLGNGVEEPLGIDLSEDVNIISMGVNGGQLTNYDPFSEAVEDIADHNGQAGAVLMAPRTFYTLDRLKEATTNAPLTPPQSFIDLKKYVTNQIGIADKCGTETKASKAFIGDFKQLLYGIRRNLEVTFSKDAGDKTFAKCEALIRCRLRCDVACLRGNHFSKVEGIKV